MKYGKRNSLYGVHFTAQNVVASIDLQNGHIKALNNFNGTSKIIVKQMDPTHRPLHAVAYYAFTNVSII